MTKLLLTYLSVIVSFHEDICPGYPRNGYLFPNGKDEHWSTDKQSLLITQEARIGIGFTITTASYRQLQVGFDREFVRTGLKRDDEDEFESDGEDDVHDRMTVHSSKTGRLHHGRKG